MTFLRKIAITAVEEFVLVKESLHKFCQSSLRSTGKAWKISLHAWQQVDGQWTHKEGLNLEEGGWKRGTEVS